MTKGDFLLNDFFFMYCLARTDITIQAMTWNQHKIENLAKVLSRRSM